VDRIEIEVKLNKDRARMLEALSVMSEEDLLAPRTRSEHDPSKTWSWSDHFIHTTLIEQNWNGMFRRHLAGETGLPPRVNPDGSPQSRAEIMAGVHKWTEAWADEQRGKAFGELVRIGLLVRSDTLQLLSELSDELLASKIPSAPWADGTVGGIMAANADHARMHFKWAEEGTASAS
jgi:hypothetical protein